jgi:serine/threonine-protein kinase
MLRPGTNIGPYRIERVLGQGGMGVVYEAVQLPLGRRLALKVLRDDLAADAAFVARFRREGRIQASLAHPHVLTVYEAGESADGLFLAMQLVRGRTLGELLCDGGVPAARALRLVGQVAEALDAAHGAGLVHRDVKPQNVLVDEADNAYLADFGLTTVGNGTAVTGSGARTSVGPVLGTVAYLAPEVIQGQAATPASDRYALAAVLFKCLAGSTVFPRSSDVAVLYAHTSEVPPAISARRPGLPRALDRVLAAGLAKAPARRPAHAKAFVDEVAAALGPEAIAALGPPPQAAMTTASPRPPRVSRSRPAGIAAAAVGGAAATLAAALLMGAGERVTLAGEPVPAIPHGAAPLGSDLATAGEPLNCRARPPSRGSQTCSVAQADLPGRRLVAPRDGAVFGWSVRDARGEIGLQVLRKREGKTFQVALSQIEVVPDGGIHTFKTNLPVDAGDFFGLVLSPGSAVGTRTTGGATTERWTPRQRGLPGSEPDHGPGTGLDREILLRADYFPGRVWRPPRQLVGAPAATVPPGRQRARRTIRFTDGRSVEVALVELRRSVVLDLFRHGRRVARIDVPDLLPGGRTVDLHALSYDHKAAVGEIGISWVNPISARIIDHYFGVLPSMFEFYG